MFFNDIIGLDHIKRHLTFSADGGRIPHAQLFVGPEGNGMLPMAIAYARYVLCSNVGGENKGGNAACNLKVAHFNHPDLHFSFPVNSTDKIKKTTPTSEDFIQEWTQFLHEFPYGNLSDWYQYIGLNNKQGLIGVDEAERIYQRLHLRSYEGGYKVMIMWMAETMNNSASNKLLKLFEEPPANTLFILITENEESLLSTIRSRFQVLHFPPLSQHQIAQALVQRKHLTPQEAQTIAHKANGDYHRALDIINNEGEDKQFEQWFVHWVRAAFKAKGNKTVIRELISWSEEVASSSRDIQKRFLNYCTELFRQALLLNYDVRSLIYLKPNTGGFDLEKFAPFVNTKNIEEIFNALDEAIYHIERNGNGKIILTDLSIRLTRLLHKS